MKQALFTFALLLAMGISVHAQTDKIIGKWKTIDDKDGSAKSIVSVFKATNGKYYGKIDKLFKDPDKLCVECQGANKNQPILGLLIINDLIAKDNKLIDGTILDPKTGKVYNCKLSLESDKDKLILRASLDKNGWVGRTQTWIRVK